MSPRTCYLKECNLCGRTCSRAQKKLIQQHKRVNLKSNLCLRCACYLAMVGKWSPGQSTVVMLCKHTKIPPIIAQTGALIRTNNIGRALKTINKLAAMDECTRAAFYVNREIFEFDRRFVEWFKKNCASDPSSMTETEFKNRTQAKKTSRPRD